RPDLVKRFLEKASQEGWVKTFKEAMGRLDNPVPLGYSSAGIVVEVGTNVHKFSPGDRVACVGAGYASHAEYVRVPEMLCARIPDGVTFDEAAFGMLGIIALHGIRCAKLNFGDSVAVIGLGLLGQLSVQMLSAYGCRVIGTDLDLNKVELAKNLGADVVVLPHEFKKACEAFTHGYGVDAVILTVATSSDEPIHTAVDVCRFGGRIVVVGVADIHPNRNEMWHKEVEIIVSKAAGPGSLDPVYENKGIDYPYGHVRWTENRNLEEFLRLVSKKKVNVASLITHRFKIEDAEKVYADVIANRGGPYIGVLFEYGENNIEQDGKSVTQIHLEDSDQKVEYPKNIGGEFLKIRQVLSPVKVGVIGAGLFGKAVLLPAIKNTDGIELTAISTSSGINTQHIFRKYGFKRQSTEYKSIIEDEEIDAVFILTPHSLHARMVIEALKAGKHVFVEKPLCVDEGELKEIFETYSSIISQNASQPFIMVGYNRRFSPHAKKIKEVFKNRQDPMVVHYRVNAGYVPPDHWVHSEEEGGSRVVGEVCHFVDFMQFLTNATPIRVYAERVSGNNRSVVNSDNVVITIKFSDGSVGDITYSASGDRAYSREQVEIFCEGKSIVSRDFKETFFYINGKKKSFKTMNQEMGYKEELRHFVDVICRNSQPELTPIEIYYSTLTVFLIDRALERGQSIAINEVISQ
ncbi:MAG: bi-domain-containing oxidoreductase, partial [Candidatus Bilamarchaeaceae archaeon]